MFVHLQPPFGAFSARAQGSTFILIQSFIHYRHLLLLLLLCRNFFLHHVYCNLVEYCNIVYCGTLYELYYNPCEHQEQQINLVHKQQVPRVTLHYLWTHGVHSSQDSITQNIRPSVNELWVSLVFYLKLQCLSIYINNYTCTVTKGTALYISVT